VPTTSVASNLEVQTYHGRRVLTWWQGDVTATGLINSGEDVVVDEHYRPVARLRGKDGWVLTLHSMVIQGDAAWVTANRNVTDDLSRFGGVSNGVLVDSAVQKYDLRTGRLLQTWRASDHIPLSDSKTQPPPNGFPWDAYHVNSIAPAPGGRLLVSMRNTWAVYLIDPRTGRIQWQLGGRHSTFTSAPDAAFEWQHDATMDSGSVVSLFDNHCCEITGAGQYLAAKSPSRGLVLRLDPARHTATRVREYSHGATFRSQYMGNVDQLPGGDVVVGWGQVPFLSTYTKAGRLLFDGAFPEPDISYRTHVQRWVGRPLDPPRAAAVTQGAGSTTVYASWNGATEVAAWRVVDLANGGHATVAHRRRSGFETALRVPRALPRVEVQALDARGRVIGTSHPVQAKRQSEEHR
jgi:hypothetical protein